MASVVLTQRGVSDTLYASGGINVGSGGLNTPTGNVVAKNIIGTRISVADDDPAGSNAGLDILNKSVTAAGTAASLQSATFIVPSGTANTIGEGVLTLFTRDSTLGSTNVIASTQVPPRGLVPPTVTNAIVGSQAIWGMLSAAQSGTATIPLAATTIAVANTAVTASTIVMVTPTLIDATATSFAVAVTAGVGFSIDVNAAPTTAALPLNWFIVRY